MGDENINGFYFSAIYTIGRTSEESSEESSRKILFYFLEEKNLAWRKMAIDLLKKSLMKCNLAMLISERKAVSCNKESPS